MPHSSRGSLWKRWDLHFHTPSSFDYHDKSVTDEQIVERLRDEEVRVVAITDHHVIDVPRIRKLQDLGGDDLTVLPGMELRSDHGGKPINYICIFPEDCDLDHVWTTFQGKLGLTSEGLRQKGGDDKVYVPIEDGAQAARELGGVISIHAGGKSNSIEGISNREQFQQRIKYDITSKWVDLLEVGQLKDIDRYLNIVFPATGLDKPLIICSDNHQVSDYAVKSRLWFRADPTFRGLLMVLREPSDRVFIGDRPPSDVRVEQNRTKYIRSVSFKKTAIAVTHEKWFSGKVEFNPGLVAIIGNKGSGKSALSDSLGLLGSTKNSEAFSFLTDNRFLHARSSLASEFEATLEWESGESTTRSLDEAVNPEEVERVKYLPQDHVENVCNEIIGIGEEEGFERELKSVIFSHVPETQRLRHTNLDDLVQFQTDEKQNRIDSLLKQLRESTRSRVRLEAQTDSAVRPEGLLRRVIHIASSAGEYVLDSFAGSGTTGAVAQKLGRRWIMVELGEQIHTHIIPRLKKVIDGTDQGGISKAVNWKGGGGFRYYRLAPSLLEKDKWGNWVINKEYNAAMLAEALCKLEGFTYAPSDTTYWQHGHSTERDFVYVTTAHLTHDQLQQLSDEVGPDRTLLVLCTAFRARADQFSNLTVKKIPKAVLSRCEYGHDDYSLQVENLPQAPPEPGQQALFDSEGNE